MSHFGIPQERRALCVAFMRRDFIRRLATAIGLVRCCLDFQQGLYYLDMAPVRRHCQGSAAIVIRSVGINPTLHGVKPDPAAGRGARPKLDTCCGGPRRYKRRLGRRGCAAPLVKPGNA